jgi:hypothetical protein
LVEVAFAASRGEAEAVRGLLDSRGIACFLEPFGLDGVSLRYGVVEATSHRVMVRARDTEEARAVLASVEGDATPEEADLANARNIEGAGGRRLRNYSALGATTRAAVFSIGAMALVFALFLLIHAL